MIISKNISLVQNKKTILNDISCSIPKGRITTFLGKSGAGKTSLLKCAANLNENYSGVIALQGKNIKDFSHQERAQHIGFVAQQFNLFPHMTVLENCIHPMITTFKQSTVEATKKALSILASLGIEDKQEAYPARLSGGQQQRVAIARALCLEPQVLLFDEPTSALDPETTKSLQTLIKELSKAGITIALSSHDMSFVKGLLDHVYFLEDGKIVDTFDTQENELKPESKIGYFLSH